MEKTIETGVPGVMLSDLERMINKIKEDIGEQDVSLSFEFIIGSLFPTSWTNIQNALAHQYTLGYIQGREEAESKFENE